MILRHASRVCAAMGRQRQKAKEEENEQWLLVRLPKPNQRAQLSYISQRADTAIAAGVPMPMFAGRAR